MNHPRNASRRRLIQLLTVLSLGAATLSSASAAPRRPACKQGEPASALRPKRLHADLRCFPWKRRQLIEAFRPKGGGTIRVAFFDADSTLRVSRSGSPAANDRRDVYLLPMVAPPIRKLVDEGWLVAVVSNQGGIDKGYVKFAAAQGALRHTCRLLARLGVPVHWFDFADAYDENRKPGVGMGLRLDRFLKERFGRGIDWRHSMMVGDSAWKKGQDVEPGGLAGEDWSASDRGFAESLRRHVGDPRAMRFHHPREFFGWERLGVRNFHSLADVKAFLKSYPDLDPGVNGW